MKIIKDSQIGREVAFLVMTSDPGLKYMPGFMYLWDTFANEVETVYIGGYSEPDFALLPAFHFDKIGSIQNYPVEKWTNGFIDELIRLKDRGYSFVIPFLEDYWIMRPVNWPVVTMAWQFARYWIKNTPGFLKIDLTSDRALSGHAREEMELTGEPVDFFRSLDPQYKASLQTSLWSIDSLLHITVANRSPWEFELEGSARLENTPYKNGVYGTYQWPVKYQIVVNKGVLDRAGKWMYPPRSIAEFYWAQMDAYHIVPDKHTDLNIWNHYAENLYRSESN